MLEDVAVKHPVAGVVGDEGDFDTLARRQQDGVLPFPESGRLAVTGQHPKGVAVQVHGMVPSRLVGHRDDAGPAVLEREDGVYDMAAVMALTMTGRRDAVDGPGPA